MKKTLLLKQIALAILLLVPFAGNAQRLLDENFGNYNSGGLATQGEWTVLGAHTADPIQLVSADLSYPGYQETASGKAVELGTGSVGQDLKKTFSTEVLTDLYYSALVNFKEADISAGKETYFLCLVKRYKTTSEFAKIYVKQGSSPDKVILGIARQNDQPANISYSTTELDLNTTHLVVVRYQSVPDMNNDKVSLYINTTNANAAPAAVYAGETGSDVDNFGNGDGFDAIELRQGATATKQAANVLVDALRVSTGWEGLFDETGGGEEPDPTPSLSADQDHVMVQEEGDYNVYIGREYPFSINLKGQNLKGDITVSVAGSSNGQVTTEATTIGKADAEAEDGADVTFMLRPNTLDWNYSEETIVFSAEGVSPVEISVYWQAADLIEVDNIAAFRSEFAKITEEEAYTTSFLIKNEFIVSHVYEEEGDKALYVQDATGGLKIVGVYGSITTDYRVGDKLADLHIFAQDIVGVFATPVKDFGAPLSQGHKVTVAELTLAELAAQGTRYEGCLVKVSDVTLTPNETGIFGDAGTIYIHQADNKATLKTFEGTDFIGTAIPETARSITGISTSETGTAIAPRSISDIVTGGTVGIDRTPENKISISVKDGMIQVSGDHVQRIEVYTLTGVKAASASHTDRIGLPTGAYIVKATPLNGTPIIQKVLVK